MIWLEECPYLDQGLVVPVVMQSGRVVLMCDSCGTVWCRPEDISEDQSKEQYLPQPPDWSACGDTLQGGVRSASAADLELAGWAGLPWKR